MIGDEAGYFDSALGGQSNRLEHPSSTTPTAFDGVGSVAEYTFGATCPYHVPFPLQLWVIANSTPQF